MNLFIEGLQGTGKSTLVNKLSERFPDVKVYRKVSTVLRDKHPSNKERAKR